MFSIFFNIKFGYSKDGSFYYVSTPTNYSSVNFTETFIVNDDIEAIESIEIVGLETTFLFDVIEKKLCIYWPTSFQGCLKAGDKLKINYQSKRKERENKLRLLLP